MLSEKFVTYANAPDGETATEAGFTPVATQPTAVKVPVSLLIEYIFENNYKKGELFLEK